MLRQISSFDFRSSKSGVPLLRSFQVGVSDYCCKLREQKSRTSQKEIHAGGSFQEEVSTAFGFGFLFPFAECRLLCTSSLQISTYFSLFGSKFMVLRMGSSGVLQY